MDSAETQMDPDTNARLHDLDKRQTTHVVECTARYAILDGRMRRAEWILGTMLVITLLGIGNHPNGVIGFIRDLILTKVPG